MIRQIAVLCPDPAEPTYTTGTPAPIGAYRTLFAAVRQSVREGRYTIEQTYEAAAPLPPGALVAALRSWSVYPVYLGLLLIYAVAASRGWPA